MHMNVLPYGLIALRCAYLITLMLWRLLSPGIMSRLLAFARYKWFYKQYPGQMPLTVGGKCCVPSLGLWSGVLDWIYRSGCASPEVGINIMTQKCFRGAVERSR